MRPTLLCLLLLCSLLTAGCSAIDFAYNNAPSFVASELEDAFDLDDAQRDELDAGLEHFFRWHRQEELARYQQILDKAALNAADGITAPELLEFVDTLRLAWRRLLEQAIDNSGDLALTLTPDQIEHYQRYYRDDFGEYADYLEMSAQQREIFRVDSAIERLEKWFGPFDNAQLVKIRPRLQQLPEFYLAWIRFREARQRALVNALREAPRKGLSHQQLKSILLDPEADYARAFEVDRIAYWQAYALTVEEISGWLSKAQLRHAIARLQKYSRSIADLRKQDPEDS
jgi:hypothetical protein